jgi:hypothetical protein
MKIPVGRTIEDAFGFVFRNILSVLGIIWFPYLVASAIIVGATLWLLPDWRNIFDNMGTDPTVMAATMIRVGRIFTVAWPVLLVATAMVEVGLLRKALGLHEGPMLIYFSLGAPVWRMVGAFILLFFIFIAIVLAGCLGAGVVIGLAWHFAPTPARWFIDGIAGIAAFVWVVYAAIRVRFFVPVVVVAEGHIGIGRAWHLGGGNVLRIIVISLVIAIAVGIVFGIITTLASPAIPFPMFSDHPDPQAFWRWYSSFLHSVGPIVIIVRVVESALLTAFFVGAAASAYRSVAGPGVEGMHS